MFNISSTLTYRVLLGDPVVNEIQTEAKDVISNEVLPAFKNLQIYLETEYTKHARQAPGISVLPQGLTMYQAYLEYHTTIEGITPGKSTFTLASNLLRATNTAAAKLDIYNEWPILNSMSG